MTDLLKDEQAPNAVEDRSRFVPAVLHLRELLEYSGFAQTLPDRVDVERRPHQNGAVRSDQVHRIPVTELQLAEQAVEVAQAHAAGDDPAKRSVRVGDPPAESDQVLSISRHPGTADIQASVRLPDVNLKKSRPE